VEPWDHPWQLFSQTFGLGATSLLHSTFDEKSAIGYGMSLSITIVSRLMIRKSALLLTTESEAMEALSMIQYIISHAQSIARC
jgi:hypothetical protein